MGFYSLENILTTAFAQVAEWFSANAYLGFFTCLLPAILLICKKHSITCLIPVAANGCPQPFRPPLGFIGISPSKSSFPFSMNFAPSPFSAKPKASIAIISEIENISFTSAKLMSLWLNPAFAKAVFEASFTALNWVMSSLSCNERKSELTPLPINFILFLQFSATSSLHMTTTEQPSQKDEDLSILIGSAAKGLLKMSLLVIKFLNCAISFSTAFE